MATNDVNLQVINSMTPEKMNALKGADGKIPSLANQLIITDEEDVNLSQLRTEIVYDMTSSDTEKNWGYAGGITGNVIVSGKDFSKYDKLIIHATFENKTSGTGILDLSHKLSETGTYRTKLIFGTASSSFGYYYCFVRVSGDKTEFANGEIGYGVSGSVQAIYDKTYFISKIEGILKSPSMIYTGSELHEGNGISIENGVISAKGYTAGSGISISNGVISRATTKKRLTGSYYNCVTNNIPISLSTILQYDFISIDVMGRSGGGGYLGTETKLIPVDTIIQNPSGNAGNNITYYNQRYALLGVIHLKFNTNEIVTLGIFASPYNTTNLEAVTNDNVFVGNVWGYKL